jgi:Protein of unknown function (DUF3570)
MLQRISIGLGAVASLVFSCLAHTAVLPDDRADIFYSIYKGGGLDITGKSLLVRKKFFESVSVQADYFVDVVSGASIDVDMISGASEIREERKQTNIGVNYIRGKTSYAIGYTNSKENDYKADSARFSISQDMFGDLTTVEFGFSRGWDKVGKHGTNVFNNPLDRRNYNVGITQVITKDIIAGATLETITEEGDLNSPYREYRFLAPGGAYGLAAEILPRTRTANAISLRGKYYLPYRAAVSASYRFFRDTWGIRGNTIELGYTHPIENRWILEGRLRYYQQNNANFYSDLFPRRNFQNFMSRDRNLAESNDTTLGVKATYAFLPDGWRFIKRGTATLDVSRIMFKYKNFRDIHQTTVAGAGNEPQYKYSANVVQIYISGFF